MTRAIDELLPQILPFAPSAPEPIALRYIIEACRELCHSARLWRVWHDVQVVVPEAQPIITVPDAEIVEIQAARLNNHDLQAVTVGWLDESHPGWDREAAPGSARFITQTNPRLMSFWPREKGTAQIRLVLQPSLNAQTLPDVLVGLHATTVGRGAAGMMLMLPTASFANPNLGAALISEFRSKLASLKVEHTKGQPGARLRTKGAFF
jgi:hypothetical protein